MGYKTPKKMYIPITMSSLAAPADSTTYYFSNWDVGADTSATTYPFYVPHSGKITYADLTFAYSAAPTQENNGLYVRVNGVDSTLDTAFQFAAASPTHEVWDALNISVVKGQTLLIKWTTPAWVTNPTSVRVAGFLILEYD